MATNMALIFWWESRDLNPNLFDYESKALTNYATIPMLQYEYAADLYRTLGAGRTNTPNQHQLA